MHGGVARAARRARQELGVDQLLRRSFDLGLELRIDPVEEVEMADPDDAGHDVNPAEEEVHQGVDGGVHDVSSRRVIRIIGMG